MATRGREANWLYVDTSCETDKDTAHDVGDPVPVEEVLKKVLATSGAEVSATQTRDHEAAAASIPSRLDAEGAAIQHHRQQERYTNLLLGAGVQREQIEPAKVTDRWRPMLVRMGRAEQLGLDLKVALDAAQRQQNHTTPLVLGRVYVGLGDWIVRHEGSRSGRAWPDPDATPVRTMSR